VGIVSDQIEVSPRLRLVPLSTDHLDEPFSLLDDPALHGFTGGDPRTREELDRWIRAVAAGGPPDRSERWCNWVVVRRDDDAVVGTVQATVVGSEASLAWVTGTAFQGRGYAKEAAAGMVAWLRDLAGVTRSRAAIHPDHRASQAIARSLGLAPTDEIDDGEVVWRSPVAEP